MARGLFIAIVLGTVTGCSLSEDPALEPSSGLTSRLIDSDGDGHDSGIDCNDADPNNWTSCALCTDDDFDGWWRNCDAYTTIAGPDCDDTIFGCTDNCAIDDNDNSVGDCIECDTIDTDADNDGDHVWYCNGYDCDDTDPDAWFCTQCSGHIPIDADSDGVCRDFDCDDHNAAVWDECSECRDEDGDGYWIDCESYSAILGPDCDDTRFDCNVNCAITDTDGDGVNSECGFGPDCDDSDPNNWSFCGGCQDYDQDGSWFGCDDYLTIAGPDCNDLADSCDTDCAIVDADNDGAFHDPCGFSTDCDDSNASLTTLCNGCVDNDHDGYFVGCVTALLDCDDTNNQWQTSCGTTCTDRDHDGVCASSDCDDFDVDNWASCTACVDADSDGLWVGCDQYVFKRKDCNDSSATACPPISGPRPIIECKTAIAGGGTRALFGYENSSTVTNIPVGAGNQITVGATYRGQPTQFLDGRRYLVFSVEFPSTAGGWTLNGQTAALGPSVPTCPADNCPAGQGATQFGECLPVMDSSSRNVGEPHVVLLEDIPVAMPTFANATAAVSYIRERVERFALGTIDEDTTTASAININLTNVGGSVAVSRNVARRLDDEFADLVGGLTGKIQVGLDEVCIRHDGCASYGGGVCPPGMFYYGLDTPDGCMCGPGPSYDDTIFSRSGNTCNCVAAGADYVNEDCWCPDGTRVADNISLDCVGHGYTPPSSRPGVRTLTPYTFRQPVMSVPQIPGSTARCDNEFCIRGESVKENYFVWNRVGSKTFVTGGGLHVNLKLCRINYKPLPFAPCIEVVGTHRLYAKSQFYTDRGDYLGELVSTVLDKPEANATKAAVGVTVKINNSFNPSLGVSVCTFTDCSATRVCSYHQGEGDTTTRVMNNLRGTYRAVGSFLTGKSCLQP